MKTSIRNVAMLPLLLLLEGDTPKPIESEAIGPVSVFESSVCSTEKMHEQIIAILKDRPDQITEKVQIFVPAGPNRSRNVSAAAHLAEDLHLQTQFDVELAIHVDEETGLGFRAGEQIDSTSTEWQSALSTLSSFDEEFMGKSYMSELENLSSTVRMVIVPQKLGTSYTEVSDAVSATRADHLIFVSHNSPHRERVHLAVQNTLMSSEGNSDLDTVSVFCHSDNPLPSNLAKETVSLVIDETINFTGGHTAIMESSRGGHRLARMKKWLESLVGLESE